MAMGHAARRPPLACLELTYSNLRGSYRVGLYPVIMEKGQMMEGGIGLRTQGRLSGHMDRPKAM